MSAIKSNSPIWALGAMSGTSLDGIDAAMLRTDGHEIFEFGPRSYRAYSDEERQILTQALGQWEGPAVEAAAQLCDEVHVQALQDFDGADLIGFHGQTLAHAPRLQGTLQVGNGSYLARALDTPVVWDFRSADVALGGEGAPLAPFFHHACARYIGETAPVVFLNLGGVGNVTWVDPRIATPGEEGALLAFDTGPANAPINDLMQKQFGLPYDKNGEIAAKGQVDRKALERFLTDLYFLKTPPKSLDRNDFDQLGGLIENLSMEDAAATLCAICAAAVAAGLQHSPSSPTRVLVSGGGRRNPVLMQMLQEVIDCPVVPIEDVNLDGDMLEAQAFAYLAVRVARGLPTSCPSTTGVSGLVSGGTFSRPAVP